MDTFTAIKERRAVKHYDANFKMPEADYERLMDLALLAPTSFNIQNWRFVVVRDAEQKKKLRAAAWDQAQVSDACLAIVICGDIKSWAKSPERYWRNAPESTQEVLVPMIEQFYTASGEQVQRDEVMRSAGIAGQTIMLAAKAMGYDSCPMIGFDAKQVADLIGLPEGHAIGFMVVVGKALKPATRAAASSKSPKWFIPIAIPQTRASRAGQGAPLLNRCSCVGGVFRPLPHLFLMTPIFDAARLSR